MWCSEDHSQQHTFMLTGAGMRVDFHGTDVVVSDSAAKVQVAANLLKQQIDTFLASGAYYAPTNKTAGAAYHNTHGASSHHPYLTVWWLRVAIRAKNKLQQPHHHSRPGLESRQPCQLCPQQAQQAQHQ
jgi:hypothetical protein